MPGMSGGPAGRRWIEAGPLHQVRRVDPGGPHRYQELSVAGHGVVPLLPVQLVVPDHDGVHAGHPRGGPERAIAGAR